MKKFLTLCLVLAFIISGTVACKKVSRDSDSPYGTQQEETEIDEIIATEDEEVVDADTGTVTDEVVVEEANVPGE